MQATEGWKVIEDWLNNEIKFFTKSLTVIEDYEKIRRHQEAVKCFESVKTFVSSVINQSRVIKEQRDQQTPRGDNLGE